MKQLIGIRLVPFFLYEARDITIGRTSGIFGANGSGKSSLLDAVQIVMLGASAHRGHGVVFNAQADEKKASTRSIRAPRSRQPRPATRSDAQCGRHQRLYVQRVVPSSTWNIFRSL